MIPTPTEIRTEQRVLIAAPTGRDADVLSTVLDSAGVETYVCPDAECLCREIRNGAAAALVAEELLTSRSRALLADVLSRQPEWSDFPLIVITPSEAAREGAWQPLDGRDRCVHAVLLERPIRRVTLLSTVHAALLSRARQYQVRDELQQRVRAVEALEKSEHRYRTLFESIDEGFCIVDVLFNDDGEAVDYRFLEVNPAFAKQTGLESAAGRTARELVPDLEDHWCETYGRVARTGEPVRFQNSAGALGRTFDVYAFRFDAPELNRVAILFRDVTGRVHSEQQLRKARDELEQRVHERTAELAQQNRRLRRLANELSHAEHRERKRLAKHLHDGLQQFLVAGKMQLPLCRSEQSAEAVERLGALLDDAIAASRSLAHELSPPALHTSELPEVLAWLARWFRTNHHFSVQVETDPNFPALPEQIKSFVFSAVRELLLNSVKHSGSDSATVELHTLRPGLVGVTVSDKGRGFEPDVLQPDDELLHGFGLYSIQERIVALGGTFEIDASPGQGAAFSLQVPVAEEREEHDPAGSTTLSPAPKGSGHHERNGDRPIRVLIVDDHGIVREGLSSLLQRQEQIDLVGEAADGIEALEQTEKLQPDVVLMDVNMPRMNGVEATRRIKRSYPRTSIIGLSFHEEQDMAEAMCRAGASAYLQKGGDAETLFETIRDVSRQ